MKWITAALAVTIAIPAVGAFHLRSAFATRRPQRTGSLRATIYYPGGAQESDEFFNYEDEYSPPEQSRLKEQLTKHEMGALARLAVAFCPEGQKLGLKNIEHVEVLNLDENHLDIQAVVCSTNDGCVTVKVPVAYPHPCYGDDVEGCILDNFYELDHVAEERVREIEWCEKRAEEAQLCWKQLTQHDDFEFPSWWTPALELAEECDVLRDLLNEEEFRPDLIALATHSLLKASKPPLPPAPKPVAAPSQPIATEVETPVEQDLSPIDAFIQSVAETFRQLVQAFLNLFRNDSLRLASDVSDQQVGKRERIENKEEKTVAELSATGMLENIPLHAEIAQPPLPGHPENQALADGIEQAAVATICPTGMYMRAKTVVDGETKILEIPVAFERKAVDVDDLREIIMSAIDAVATAADAAPVAAP